MPSGSLYCAVRNYSTSKSDEVGVAIGCVVEALRKSDDGWWLVRYRTIRSSYRILEIQSGRNKLLKTF